MSSPLASRPRAPRRAYHSIRNGQVELETAQLNLNVKPEYQFQARVIVNWGALFSRK